MALKPLASHIMLTQFPVSPWFVLHVLSRITWEWALSMSKGVVYVTSSLITETPHNWRQIVHRHKFEWLNNGYVKRSSIAVGHGNFIMHSSSLSRYQWQLQLQAPVDHTLYHIVDIPEPQALILHDVVALDPDVAITCSVVAIYMHLVFKEKNRRSTILDCAFQRSSYNMTSESWLLTR